MQNAQKETYEIRKVCRCCLKSNGQMKPLFGFSLDEMLRSITNLQVEPSDGLPELICFQCVLQLSRSFRFKMQCLKSNKTIREYITNTVNGTSLICESISSSKEDLEGDDKEFQYKNDDNIETIFATEERDDFDNNLSIKEGYKTITGILNNTISNTKTTEFECGICNKTFPTKKQMTRHKKNHDDNKPHKCPDCDKTFSQSCNLRKHSLKHTGELKKSNLKPHLCSVCGKNFKYASSLCKHMKFHTGKNLLYCPSCPKFFSEKATLKNHLRCHSGDRPFVCPHCNRSFTHSCNFQKHIRTHSDLRPFKCNVCDRTFVERNYLTVHMQIHGSGKKALCSTCGKCLANAKSLYAHMQLHSNNRLHSCGFENCNKSFSRLDTLRIHQRIHTGEKPFSCSICKHSFTTATQLSNHLRTHTGEKPFSCEHCILKFSTKKSLKVHLNKHENSNFKSNEDIVSQEDKQHISFQHHREEQVMEQSFDQSVILLKINENGELVSETECALISNT